MKQYCIKNGIKLVYEKIYGDITSFSMSFNAGAIVEGESEMGLAHVVEHMLFKGTKNKSESEINKLCDQYFGFNNAMTNYPYAVYYGTCLSTDFSRAFGLYSDIIMNPSFPEEGFEEEIDVICQELKEWKDDVSQFCEDELFLNAFENRRIKNLIIGTEESIRSFSRKDLISFYMKHYNSEGCVISVVSSIDFEDVCEMVDNIFSSWKTGCSLKNYMEISNGKNKKLVLYEGNKSGTFVKLKKDIETAKIQYIFPMHHLNNEEVKALRIFNAYFGEGTSGLLYDKIRTENGLAYDITSSIKNETGIKLFTIYVGTSKDKIEETINLINEQIEKVKNDKGVFTQDKINKLCRSIRLKRSLGLEQSIRLSLNLAVYGIMYDEACSLYDQMQNLECIDEKMILTTINKVLNKPSIQVIEPCF